jgi:hypothetical protein
MTLWADGATLAVPRDERRVWAAEIEWREDAEGARFVVMACPTGSSAGATIAESPALTWPPTDSDSVRALVEAVTDLELALVAAGWTPVAPGRPWYAKRFAWEPPGDATPTLPAPELAALFAPQPPWPDSTAGQWRCEIAWDAGWAKSAFRALAYAPGERRGREIRRSRALPWLLMAQPSPASNDHRRELESLIGALTAAGWEPIGTGAGWYARRFFQPGDDGPDDLPGTRTSQTGDRDSEP